VFAERVRSLDHAINQLEEPLQNATAELSGGRGTPISVLKMVD
jgi:hypothetical protein